MRVFHKKFGLCFSVRSRSVPNFIKIQNTWCNAFAHLAWNDLPANKSGYLLWWLTVLVTLVSTEVDVHFFIAVTWWLRIMWCHLHDCSLLSCLCHVYILLSICNMFLTYTTCSYIWNLCNYFIRLCGLRTEKKHVL